MNEHKHLSGAWEYNKDTAKEDFLFQFGSKIYLNTPHVEPKVLYDAEKH